VVIRNSNRVILRFTHAWLVSKIAAYRAHGCVWTIPNRVTRSTAYCLF